MANDRFFEDTGRKGKRLTNNQFLYARSYNNKTDVPILKVNQNDQVEFKQVPVIEGLGALALQNPPAGSGQYFFRDPKVITSDNVSSKSFDLSHPPLNPEAVLLLVDGGPPQFYGKDFYIDGQTLKWDGGELDGLMDINDEVIVFYQM